MKSCVALILSVTTVLCSSYGSPVSGGAEFDILAKVHHRVARETSPPTNNSFTSPACMKAYQEVLDKCIAPSGLTISDFTGPNKMGETLRQLFFFLCPNSKCREAYLNYYRACIPSSSSRFSARDYLNYIEETFERFCKINRLGAFCAETYVDFVQTGITYGQICLNQSCSDESSQCRMLLRSFSSDHGCCALESYQIFVDSMILNSPTQSSPYPDDPWVLCGLPSPGQCPSPPCETTTKPVRSRYRTSIKIIDRVWPSIDSTKFVTKVHSSLSIRTGGFDQSWAIVFDDDLEKQGEFSIVNFPSFRHIMRVQRQCNGAYELVVEKIPPSVYFQQGGTFYNFGPDYIFTAKDNYIYSRFRGQFIQHVDSGLVLNYDYASSVFLSPLRKNTFRQAWVYRDLKSRLFSERQI